MQYDSQTAAMGGRCHTKNSDTPTAEPMGVCLAEHGHVLVAGVVTEDAERRAQQRQEDLARIKRLYRPVKAIASSIQYVTGASTKPKPVLWVWDANDTCVRDRRASLDEIERVIAASEASG